MTASRRILSATLIGALVAVSACGRKAPLDTPYEAEIQARKDADKAKQPLPPEPQEPVKDRKFFLDFLL